MVVDPNITAAGVSLVTNFITRGDLGPGKTLGDIWDIVLGNYFHALNDKSKIKHQVQVDDFKNKLAEEILKIAKEKLQDPRMSIVGPALEASKYYFDEKEIREVFANLIASSMDSTYNGLVQHSFVEIIKQLSPYDAKLFKSFKDMEPYVSLIDVYDKGLNKTIIDRMYISQSFNDYKLNEISIDNLIRLGFIKIEEESHLDKDSLYEHYSKFGTLASVLKTYDNNKFCVKKYFVITAFGKAFKKVCIKDSL